MPWQNNGPWTLGRMVGFDTETTGVDVEQDRIVTAAVVAVGGGEATRSRTWMADPGIEIPAQATAVHGITTEQARTGGTDAAAVVEEVTAVLAEHLGSGVPVVVFNARYDLTLLDREARRHDLVPLAERLDGLNVAPVLDPLVIDKHVDRYRRGSRKLTALAAHYRIEHGEAHSAEADALAAARLAWRLGVSHHHIGAADLVALHDAQTLWAAEQAAGLEEYLRRTTPDAVVEPAWPYLPHTLTHAPTTPVSSERRAEG